MSDRIVRCPYVPDTIHVPDESFGKTLWTSVERNKSQVALVEVATGQSVTYGEFRERAELVARRLLGQGVHRGDAVAIFSPNSVEWMIVATAVLRIGAIPSAINCLLSLDELVHQMRVCKAKFIFTTRDLADKTLQAAKTIGMQVFTSSPEVEGCTEIGSTLPCQSGEIESLPPLPSFEELSTSPDQVAMVFFSSGTTGPQKGVQLSHRNLQYEFAVARHPKCQPYGKVQLAFAPLSHATGFHITAFGLIFGSTTHLMTRFDAETFLRTLDENKIERVVIVPPLATLMVKCAESQKYRLSHLKDIICAAAPLSAEVEDLLLEKYPGAILRQLYGMTEVSGLATAVPLEERDKFVRKPGTAGVPQPGVEMKVVDLTTGEPLGPRESGEICMKSPLNMVGYANNPEATAATIHSDGWLYSGDIGYYDEDGYFFVTDRLKELIKYNAYQVAPAELEAVLLSHPDVADAAVVGLPDKEHGELPLAWVVKKPSATITETQLQQFVNDKVAPYKRLRAGVHFVSAVPKTASGKILRKDIKAALFEGKM